MRRAATRRKPLLHRVLVARIALSILMIPTGAVAQASAGSSASAPAPAAATLLSPSTAQAVESELATLFRTQTAEGGYVFSNPPRGFGVHPLFATAAVDAYRATGNTNLLSQAAYSIPRYYAYLFESVDRDGDRLVETPVVNAGRTMRVEDPGVNALLAIDMLSLARVQLTLRRTMLSLYWYDLARSIERAVVAVTFDPEANYFVPRDATTGQVVRDPSTNPIAALPAAFDGALGDNHLEEIATRMVRWAGEYAASTDSSADPDARAARALAASEVLRGGAHASVASALRAAGPGESASSVFSRYARERASLAVPLVDHRLALDLLLAVVRGSQKFTDADVVRLQRSIPVVQALAGDAPPDAKSAVVDFGTGDQSVRALYTAVSDLREKLRTGAFFGPDDARAFPGADASIATQRLLDDVLSTLRDAETRLFAIRFARAGLTVQADLAGNDAVTGETITMRWQLSTRRPLVCKSIAAGVFGESIANASPTSPVRIAANAPLRFNTRVVVNAGAGAPRVIPFALVIEDSAGARYRGIFNRSVYVHPPVGIVAHFPRGRTIRGDMVPITIDLQRHSRASIATQYFWFSPAGLKVHEGNTGRIIFGAADSTAAELHVEIPTPCRPGVFPFTLKFYANDRDVGTISSSLFKPYQWTFVGPFPTDGGMKRAQAPEAGVNLLQSYPVASGQVQWRVLPESSSGAHGEISLRGAAPERGVYYLYTIVACAYETDVVAHLTANAPAALFVNGRRALGVSGSTGDSASATVHLAADRNHILIKVLGDANATVSFSAGNDDNLAADEFDNDLMELAGGYRELTTRELNTGNATQESRRLVTLRYQNAEAQSVAVVGSFNGWSPGANPMQKKDGVWELTLSLAPGKYAYRFLVDQRKQVLDPSGREEPDGYGGKNSVLVVQR